MSAAAAAASTPDELADEVELLKSIYLDRLSATVDASGAVVRVSVEPRSESNGNVRASLILRAVAGAYPVQACQVTVDVAKGIEQSQLQTRLSEAAQSLVGGAMLFDIIERCIDLVSETNASGPAASCSICMSDLERDELWLRTACFHFFHVDCLAGWYAQQRSAYQAKRDSLVAFHEAELAKLAPFALLCPDCRSPVDAESRSMLRLHMGDADDDLEPWMRSERQQAAAQRAAADAAAEAAARRAAELEQRADDERDAELRAIVTPCVLARPVPRELLEPLRLAATQRHHALTVRAMKHPVTRAHTGLVLLTFETDAAAVALLKRSSQLRFDSEHTIVFQRVDLAVIRRHSPTLDSLIALYNLPAASPPPAPAVADAPSSSISQQQPTQSQQQQRSVFVLLTNLAPRTNKQLLHNALQNYGAREVALCCDAKGRFDNRAVVRFDGDESGDEIVKQIGVIAVLDRVLQPQLMAEQDAVPLLRK